jgi:anti-sigma factor RsiW
MWISCRDVQSLLPLFFDSELDARQMRMVALHTAKCASCEHELRDLELVQDAVAHTLAERVEEIDLSGVWTAIERRLGPGRPSWLTRLQLWWGEAHPLRWVANGPALGAAAAGVALSFTVFWTSRPAPMIAEVPQAVGSAVSIDTIEAPTNVAVLSEEDTLVLWVEDEGWDVAPVSEVLP